MSTNQSLSRVSRQVLMFGLAMILAMVSASAFAGGNDIVLRRLGVCEIQNIDGVDTCVSVTPNEEAFDTLIRDLGLVMSPRGFTPAETIGEAGFEYAFEMNFNIVDSSHEAWQLATYDQSPEDLLLTSQLHVRKGLPFSFQMGAVLTHLFDSDLWALGGELQWSLHEDYLRPVPDLGVRGFVNHTVGSTDLNLTTAGFDVLLDETIGIGGMFNLTPYAGYNFTLVAGSSRLLDASPGDPTPPMEGSGGAPSIKPEFVFSNRNQYYHRFLAGLRFRVAVLNFTFETLASAEVISMGLKVGLDF